MSDLVVVTYPDEYRAAEVLAALQRLQDKLLIDLEDAACRERKGREVQAAPDGPDDQDRSNNRFGQGHILGNVGRPIRFAAGARGAVVGAAVGATTGAVSDKLADYGIPNEFIKQLGPNLQNGTSALFVLVRRSTPDKVLAEVNQYGGTVFHSSLSGEDRNAATFSTGGWAAGMRQIALLRHRNAPRPFNTLVPAIFTEKSKPASHRKPDLDASVAPCAKGSSGNYRGSLSAAWVTGQEQVSASFALIGVSERTSR